MDRAELMRRWETAQEHNRAAEHALAQNLFRASVSRSYYACFQAMWVALGDPPKGRWEHIGIVRSFCQGRWAHPVMIPMSLVSLRRRLLNLYELRLDADYRAVPVALEAAQAGTSTSAETLHLVETHKLTYTQEEPYESDR